MFSIGDRVNVVWPRGNGGVYPADITEHNIPTNTYTITYDDGFLEDKVLEERISKCGAQSADDATSGTCTTTVRLKRKRQNTDFYKPSLKSSAGHSRLKKVWEMNKRKSHGLDELALVSLDNGHKTAPIKDHKRKSCALVSFGNPSMRNEKLANSTAKTRVLRYYTDAFRSEVVRYALEVFTGARGKAGTRGVHKAARVYDVACKTVRRWIRAKHSSNTNGHKKALFPVLQKQVVCSVYFEGASSANFSRAVSNASKKYLLKTCMIKQWIAGQVGNNLPTIPVHLNKAKVKPFLKEKKCNTMHSTIPVNNTTNKAVPVPMFTFSKLYESICQQNFSKLEVFDFEDVLKQVLFLGDEDTGCVGERQTQCLANQYFNVSSNCFHKAGQSQVTTYAVGEKVEVRFTGLWKGWFIAYIKEQNPDGTYDIVFEEGSRYNFIVPKRIRKYNTQSFNSQRLQDIGVESFNKRKLGQAFDVSVDHSLLKNNAESIKAQHLMHYKRNNKIKKHEPAADASVDNATAKQHNAASTKGHHCQNVQPKHKNRRRTRVPAVDSTVENKAAKKHNADPTKAQHWQSIHPKCKNKRITSAQAVDASVEKSTSKKATVYIV